MLLLWRFFFFFVSNFLAAPGLPRCAQAFSACMSSGHCLLRCTGFSLPWLFLLWRVGSGLAGFSSCRTQTQWRRSTGLFALWLLGSSQTRGRTHVP